MNTRRLYFQLFCDTEEQIFERPVFCIQNKPLTDGESFKYDPLGKTIVNVGSVGQPRDGDSRACALIYDTEKHEVKMKRIQYDITAVQDKMKQASLPLFLIERLSYGR